VLGRFRRATAPLLEPAPSLGREADASLRRDPLWLSDPRRLGALHARLGDALGEAETAAALLQAGCLHGLRDASATLGAGWLGASWRQAARADRMTAAPRLSLLLQPLPGDDLALAGGWHETHEADGRRASLGPSPAPACFASCGWISGWLSGLLGADLLAVETACRAAGADACRVEVRAADAWRAARDPRALALLARLDFAELRAGIAEELCDEDDEASARSLDSDLPVVHVWGPVMILPYSGADDSISTLESVGRDAAARDVAVVVLDLGGALLETGGGGVDLERVLSAIEARGAEVILAGVSPRTESVIGALAARHCALRAELPDAIATAFQIADARRRGAS
jgi:hypothetical protein